ncbi:Uma2 family endonuclease [Streptomyces albofaciens JCM 4342]|uniref:Uma2 family endonuclease n=1 Tax=Streptomyces albofaciens TaxID=66866 RepID=UPI00123B2F51|nr:Uma2 family endonuclease [Streptomyces albofaciens]KAA6213802.1 Uma2 family endonuclease [Streptomyces albofaciens JCM 4342]
MTALAHETPWGFAPEPSGQEVPRPDLDEVLWQAWEAMELPEGFHAEIIEGFIEVSPTGCYAHSQIANKLRRAADKYLADGPYAGHQDTNVIHDRKVWIPDVIIALEDFEAQDVIEHGVGVKASAVEVAVEVVSPGHNSVTRDRVRKRRAYARAGIPVYVLVDDHDLRGIVTVFTSPMPEKGDYAAEHRVPYGTDITIPEGPAKGFVIGEAITGPPRADR